MATVVERTAPGDGKLALLIGLSGLLVGGIVGGFVGVSLQSDEPVLGVQSGKQTVSTTTGALTSAGPSIDIEAVRAQRYAPAKAEFVDIESLRAQRYEAPAPAPVDIEALRAQRYAPAPQLDIEAIRAQRYAPEA